MSLHPKILVTSLSTSSHSFLVRIKSTVAVPYFLYLFLGKMMFSQISGSMKFLISTVSPFSQFPNLRKKALSLFSSWQSRQTDPITQFTGSQNFLSSIPKCFPPCCCQLHASICKPTISAPSSKKSGSSEYNLHLNPHIPDDVPTANKSTWFLLDFGAYLLILKIQLYFLVHI